MPVSVELRPSVPQPAVLASQARAEGLLLHDMQNHAVYGPVVPWLADYPTEWQADRYLGDGEHYLPEENEVYPTPADTAYTTVEPRYPDNLKSFQEKNSTQRRLGMQAVYAELRIRGIEGLEEADEALVPRLINAFRSITKVKVLDAHLEDEEKTKVTIVNEAGEEESTEKTVDGTAVFGNIQLTVADREAAAILSGTLRKWLVTDEMADPHDVPDIKQLKDGQWLVQVKNSNECDWRGMESSLGYMWEELLHERTNTVLPDNKQSLPDWEKGGETFLPWVRDQALGVIRDYRRLMSSLIVRYTGEHAGAVEEGADPEMSGLIVRHSGRYAAGAEKGFMESADPDPLGTTPAALFEVIRKVSNGLTRPIRGPVNREQHKNLHKRLMMQRLLDIRRGKSQNISLGPGSPRTPNLGEEAAVVATQYGKEKVSEFKDQPYLAPISTFIQFGMAGAEIAYELALDVLGGRKRPKEIRNKPIGDTVAWKRQKEVAKAAGAHIDQIIERVA